ncbi:flagellar transcriptional regulator FlhD [Paraburkholderia humisilvae]|uniref:Flagellar transcriptional regulator FlhD n=1 Tax=Paraburkholderia humisilvae TaxID=627669 RepID=A0A6J5FAW5_9BURK|nr:flagellar transcriptional regulator FlhD [Paraburkholderia humisilvae]CAB3774832.1 Flagellar transcriptional regulator FlhD [Paraburkholderia humisilvae]
MPNDEDLLDELSDWNRTYLRLAQRLILEDRRNGARIFGFSDEVTTLVAGLTPSQIDALATSVELVCQLHPGPTSIFASTLH